MFDLIGAVHRLPNIIFRPAVFGWLPGAVQVVLGWRFDGGPNLGNIVALKGIFSKRQA
jgi:hypothetical protein